MSQPVDPSVSPGRRRALILFVNGAVTAIGGALAGLLGVFALKPAAAAGRDRWIRAGALSDLEPSVPAVRVLVVPRVDGWYRARAPQTVFLVWDGKKEVRAVSATCTHLGCQVHWESKDAKFRCPCHGGVYDASGKVLAGPPPRPLDSLDARIDSADDTVLVRLLIARLIDWLHERTGIRTIREVLFDEPLPPGTGWFFTLGSVLLALIGVQILTGAFLTLYYAPTPDHAYDSVRFISSTGAGRMVRGLHHFGASFIVVAAALHMLRVIGFGSYKPPRELTWLSGLGALGLILAFALTGYLLPWDQRAYWATVVTINISKLAPVAGGVVAGILQGGSSIGALTLTRWYAAHVIFLPGILIAIIAAHLVLMRRQGISGPVRPYKGQPAAFFPAQTARDVTVVSVVMIALFVLAWRGMPAMEGPADPTDATFIPRPEWYFLGLFQLLKYFPGKLEVVGAVFIPTALGALLALLPWLDCGPERDPRRRRVVTLGVLAGVLAVVALTTLGWRDKPVAAASAETWSMRAIGGRQFAETAKCARCHSESGMADPLDQVSLSRGPEWLTGHVADAEMIAPGLREPPTAVSEREAAALIAYVRQATRQPYPGYPQPIETAAGVWARYCVGCHVVDGDGGKDGPELSHIGAKHDAATLRGWIADPEAVKPDTDMPAFGKRLTPEQLDAIAQYLANRK